MRTASPSCRRRMQRALALLAALALGGCSGLSYYGQALGGEIRLLGAARPVDDWLADPATPAALRERLELAQRLRAFASTSLGLPDNRSYRRYADLKRDSAVWNVFAAPEFELALKTWCYPLFGCAAYRGYFARADAEAYAAPLRAEGLDVVVAPIPAFSTLGWLSDPLLNTFINWPEPELARLIFHELAHQVLYVKDDTRFNESFATAVERAGLRRWIASRGDAAMAERVARRDRQRAEVQRLLEETRTELRALYEMDMAPAERRARKAAILAGQSTRYQAVRDSAWGGEHAWDAYFAQDWNNARLGAVASYEGDVPAFEALLAREGGELPRFFAAAGALAALEAPARRRALEALLTAATVPPAAPDGPAQAH